MEPATITTSRQMEDSTESETAAIGHEIINNVEPRYRQNS